MTLALTALAMLAFGAAMYLLGRMHGRARERAVWHSGARLRDAAQTARLLFVRRHGSAAAVPSL